MTYIVEKSSASATSQEKQLITIEFTPQVNPSETEYNYEHPLFVFGEKVELKDEKLNYPPRLYTVCALELIESKTPSGKLLNQPRWKYKITDGEQTIYWKEESAICRAQSPSTCSTCSEFEDFHESNGRGWCRQFNQQARTHHIKTNDCVLNISVDAFPTEEIIDPADQPRAEYQLGSLVKVIDSTEHHSEWAVFEIVECVYNHNLYDNTETYLNQTQWYYRLKSYQDGNTFSFHDSSKISQSFLVAENEICAFDMAHNVCTEDLF